METSIEHFKIEYLYLGTFCLGGFVGAVVTYGLHLIENYSSFAKAITTILSAALGGVALPFLQNFDVGGAISGYCAGLLIALMWAYAGTAINNIRDNTLRSQIIGWLHLLGTIAVTALGGFIFALPLIVDIARSLLNTPASG